MKLKFLAVFLLIGLGLNAQYTPMRNYGIEVQRLKPSYVLHLPVLPDTSSLHTVDTSAQIGLYQGTPYFHYGTWKKISQGITTRDRFGFSGEDTRAAENRYFSGAGSYNLILDSLGTFTAKTAVNRYLTLNNESIILNNNTTSFTLTDGTAEIVAPIGAIINGLQLPLTDGTAGQVLATDGSGVLGWADAGGTPPDWETTLNNQASAFAADHNIDMGGHTFYMYNASGFQSQSPYWSWWSNSDNYNYATFGNNYFSLQSDDWGTGLYMTTDNTDSYAHFIKQDLWTDWEKKLQFNGNDANWTIGGTGSGGGTSVTGNAIKIVAGGASGEGVVISDAASNPIAEFNSNNKNSIFSGNVGIGTASPTYALEVNGTASALTFSTGNAFYAGSSYLSANELNIYNAPNNTSQFKVSAPTEKPLIQAGAFTGYANGNYFQLDDENGNFFYDNNAHDGKFGINTASPAANLDVLGNSKFTVTSQSDAFNIYDYELDANAINVDAANKYININSGATAYVTNVGGSVAFNSVSGTVVLSSGTATVSNSYISSGDIIFITPQILTNHYYSVQNNSDGTFTIESSSGSDTAIVAYLIIKKL